MRRNAIMEVLPKRETLEEKELKRIQLEIDKFPVKVHPAVRYFIRKRIRKNKENLF